MTVKMPNSVSANKGDREYIEWKDRYSVGVERLDADHKHLLMIMNKACEACAKGKYVIYPSIIDELLEHMLIHFKGEEIHMAKLNYPGLAAHRKEHEQFYNKIVECQRKINDRNVFYSIELLDLTETINNWWDNHILESDMRYKDGAG